MLVREVAAAVERLAPLSFAEPWDKPGLLIGRPEAPVSRLLLTLDVTSEALRLAERLGSEMILSHHPLLFHPVDRLLDEPPINHIAMRCVERHLAVYAAHTNLDACLGGVNEALAAALGLRVIDTLQPLSEESQTLQLRLLEDSHVADTVGSSRGLRPGFGRICVPADGEPLHAKPFVRHLNNALETTGCLVNFDTDKTYERLVVWGGAFDGDLIPALVREKIDCLIAGEIKHHELLALAEFDIHAIAAGHDATERVVLLPWMAYLQKALPDCRVAVHPGLSYNNLVY